ncbi:MAG: hypothetical protein GC165_15335 [Armatimonadetes bacterium]|nr:hypothetical protein [Armatimonadota bacterium]MBS1725555.1 hypothetical protein [Armatimonadota bacterium]
MITSLVAFSALTTSAPDLSGWKLLDDCSHRAFNYFVERSDAATGFTKDRSANFTPEDNPEHVVASVAAVGFALSAYAVGDHRGWMTHKEAIAKSRNTIRHMIDLAPKSHGWYYHWLNWKTGKIEWNSEVSTIDSSIFFCGLILNERALKDPEISKMTSKILKGIDWDYMLHNGGNKPEKNMFTMGYQNGHFLDSDWGEYSENAMIYLLAIGLDPSLPADLWKAFERKKYEAYGKTVLSGGPLFMHQMSHIFFDFKGKRDGLGIDYWANSRLMTLLQRRYATENPKGYKGYSKDIWGFSACDIPDGYGAQGFPGGYLGDNFDNGTLAAPAALASMMFTPKESMAAADAFYREYRDAYGRYGFSSGINPTKNWHSADMIGIDQGQMMLGIENARDGWPNKTFMSHPAVKLAMKRAGFRETKEGPLENRPVIVSVK